MGCQRAAELTASTVTASAVTERVAANVPGPSRRRQKTVRHTANLHRYMAGRGRQCHRHRHRQHHVAAVAPHGETVRDRACHAGRGRQCFRHRHRHHHMAAVAPHGDTAGSTWQQQSHRHRATATATTSWQQSRRLTTLGSRSLVSEAMSIGGRRATNTGDDRHMLTHSCRPFDRPRRFSIAACSGSSCAISQMPREGYKSVPLVFVDLTLALS